jgi:hypothetical protein
MWRLPRFPLGGGGTAQSGRHIIVATALCNGAPQSSSVLVEVAGLPGATKSKTSDLTAMHHVEFRDEFSGVAARRFVILTTCGAESREPNVLCEAIYRRAVNRPGVRFAEGCRVRVVTRVRRTSLIHRSEWVQWASAALTRVESESVCELAGEASWLDGIDQESKVECNDWDYSSPSERHFRIAAPPRNNCR